MNNSPLLLTLKMSDASSCDKLPAVRKADAKGVSAEEAVVEKFVCMLLLEALNSLTGSLHTRDK